MLLVGGAWIETFSARCSSFMILASLGPMSSTSIARSGGVLSEEAGVTIISQDGGLPVPVYRSTDALVTCFNCRPTVTILLLKFIPTSFRVTVGSHPTWPL